MNILWLSHFLPYPPKGGAFQRSHYLLREAASRHRVSLVALNQRAVLTSAKAVEEATQVLGGIVSDLAWFEIPADRSRFRWGLTTALSYFRPSPYDVNWLRSWPLRRHLRERAGREHFDLIHIDTLGLLPYAAELSGVPVALNHHNIESQLMERRTEREGNPLKRHYFRRETSKLQRLERKACAEVAVNLVVSELDGERLRSISPEARIEVVSNGVDTQYFQPNPQVVRRPGSLVFAGGMNWYPNRDAVNHFLAEIWPLLIADSPTRSVAIIGKEPPKALLDATRDSRIRAPGFVDDVRPWLDEAAIYVCPIRDGGGTRLKILDALAMTKPVVATGLSVEGLDLVEGAHYLRAETPAEFLEQIRRLEKDPRFAAELGSAGRKLVTERYAWSVIGHALETAYRESAAGGKMLRVRNTLTDAKHEA
jgi:glycosyltransferase involved in cell wall biosynthesis